ncbi:uncharacterized protein VTP21DRAFT_6115 [Calcarisporiella thermophila]|uniref:uncharacterized protein n=1 Tax=Calcarisporiella thermophila TaxID=911321 RepID=UPI003743E2B6
MRIGSALLLWPDRKKWDMDEMPSKIVNPPRGLSVEQKKYSLAMLRALKKHRDAAPFLEPVDPVKLAIPDYPTIIKHPMDFSTLEKKLTGDQYADVSEVIEDFQLVFNNCYIYNGKHSVIGRMAQNLEEAFQKQIKQMPSNARNDPSTIKSEPGLESPAVANKRPKHPSKSQSLPVIRRSSEGDRPKREIHPPPPKDLPESPKRPRKADPQLRFCGTVLRELKKKQYAAINYPFLLPVDPIALGIPDYHKVIKEPMDLSTIERKLNSGEYRNATEFEGDVRLMFRNCYSYNPPSNPVHQMGQQLEEVFNRKWAEKPAPAPAPPPAHTHQHHHEEKEDSSDDDSYDDRDKQIAELEHHLQVMSQQLASMKDRKKEKREKDKRKKLKKVSKRENGGVAAAGKVAKEPKRRGRKREFADLSFEQKQELTDLFGQLNEEQIAGALQIIQENMPQLQNEGQEEIELDIDALDPHTLHKLYEYVRKCTGPKRKRAYSTGDTDSKKPKTRYSDEEQTRKIQELEQSLERFETHNGSGMNGGIGGMVRDEDDRLSSSGSDSDDGESSSSGDEL